MLKTYRVGIFGDDGSGKTFFLKQVLLQRDTYGHHQLVFEDGTKCVCYLMPKKTTDIDAAFIFFDLCKMNLDRVLWYKDYIKSQYKDVNIPIQVIGTKYDLFKKSSFYEKDMNVLSNMLNDIIFVSAYNSYNANLPFIWVLDQVKK